MPGSSTGALGNFTGNFQLKSFPGGESLVSVSFPYKKFLASLVLQDESQVVACGLDKGRTHLYVFSGQDGSLDSKILLKYNGFKDLTKMVALPLKPGWVGLIDGEKGTIMDIINKKVIKTIPSWDGSYTSDGKFGLYAPQSGGLDILDLRQVSSLLYVASHVSIDK